MTVVGSTISGEATLHVVDCPTCGCVHAIPDGVYKQGKAKTEARTIYCPNGHAWVYSGKSHDEVERELRDALAQAHAAQDQAEAAERMARAREAKERKRADRLAKRAAAGVCPHCQRTFSQLARHMRSKHPEAVH